MPSDKEQSSEERFVHEPLLAHADARTLIDHVVGEALLHVLDVDGRPLGEQASRSAYIRAGIDERPCPFQDNRARSGHPINMAALRQVLREWDSIIAHIESLTAATSQNARLTGFEIARVNAAMQFAPFVWLLREQGPIPGPIASAFKLSVGFIRTLPLITLSMEGISQTPMLDVLSPPEFFELLDAHEWLTGQTQVCAGSRTSIQRIYETMATRGTPATTPSPIAAIAVEVAPACRDLDMLMSTLICAARECIDGGAWKSLPGYGERRQEIPFDEWPILAWLFAVGSARSIELVLSTPLLRVEHMQRAFPQDARPAWLERILAVRLEPTATCLEHLDALLLELALPLVGEILEKLGGKAPLKLSREDFAPLCFI